MLLRYRLALHCNSTMTQPIQVRISRDGNEIGSYPSDEVVRLRLNGTLKETDFYWHEGMTDWAPLTQFLNTEARRELAEETLKREQEDGKNAERLALEKAKAKEDQERAALEERTARLEKEKANRFKRHSAIAVLGRRRLLYMAALCLIVGAAVYFFKNFQVVHRVQASNRPPLTYEFFNTKNGCGIMFKLTILEGSEFPYDEVIVRITRVMGSDGKSFGSYYLLSKNQLMAGRCVLNTPSGVNPFGSDCKPGDRYIIQVPKYAAPLEIVCPDGPNGLREIPY